MRPTFFPTVNQSLVISSRSDRVTWWYMAMSLSPSTFIHTVRDKYCGTLPGAQLVNTDANNFLLAANLVNIFALLKN